MRLLALLLTGILASSPAAAQQPEPALPAASSSSTPDNKPALDLPVSLEKIRDGVERPAAPLFASRMIKSLDKEPSFRVEVEERRKIEELLATLNFKTGPTPAGGLYAYEQQRMMFPPVDNPLAQPYAAFNEGQLLTILVENLAGKYLVGKAADAITKSVREHAEAAARKDVEEAVAGYCASKPGNGAGIELCAPQPSDSSPKP
jgi:hypothetical protein